MIFLILTSNLKTYGVKVTEQAAQWSNESKYSKLKTIEIQLGKPTEVCGKVLCEKNGYKSV